MIVVIGVIALVGLLPGLLLLAVMLPFFLLTLKPDAHGQTPLQRVGVRAGWRRARLGRSHLYRSGPLGQTPLRQLPAARAARRQSALRGPRRYDRPFAVLCHPWVGHLTVVIETEPDGAALVDQPQVDQWVAHYGHWLAALSEEPGLLACQVCVETAPDPGTRLRHAIAERHDPHAPRAGDRHAQRDRQHLPRRRRRPQGADRADLRHDAPAGSARPRPSSRASSPPASAG